MNNPNYVEWSREEKEQYAEKRMNEMRLKNQQLRRRHAEVENDRLAAESKNSSITNSSKTLKQEPAREQSRTEKTDWERPKYPREWDRGKLENEDWDSHSYKGFKNYSTSFHQKKSYRGSSRHEKNDQRYVSNHQASSYKMGQGSRYRSSETFKKTHYSNENYKKSHFFNDDTRRYRKKYDSHSTSSDSDGNKKLLQSNVESSTLWRSDPVDEDQDEFKQKRIHQWVTSIEKSSFDQENIPADEEVKNVSPKRKYNTAAIDSDKSSNNNNQLWESVNKSKSREDSNVKSQKLDYACKASTSGENKIKQKQNKSYSKFDRFNHSDQSSDDSGAFDHYDTLGKNKSKETKKINNNEKDNINSERSLSKSPTLAINYSRKTSTQRENKIRQKQNMRYSKIDRFNPTDKSSDDDQYDTLGKNKSEETKKIKNNQKDNNNSEENVSKSPIIAIKRGQSSEKADFDGKLLSNIKGTHSPDRFSKNSRTNPAKNAPIRVLCNRPMSPTGHAFPIESTTTKGPNREQMNSEGKSSLNSKGSYSAKRFSQNSRYNPTKNAPNRVLSHSSIGHTIPIESPYSDKEFTNIQSNVKKGIKTKHEEQYDRLHTNTNDHMTKQRKFEKEPAKSDLWNNSVNKNKGMKKEEYISLKQKSSFNDESFNQDTGGWGKVVQHQYEDDIDNIWGKVEKTEDDIDSIWGKVEKTEDDTWGTEKSQSMEAAESHEEGAFLTSTEQSSNKLEKTITDDNAQNKAKIILDSQATSKKKSIKVYRVKEPTASDDGGWSTVEEGEIKSDDD